MPNTNPNPIKPLTIKQRDRFWERVDKSAGPDECWPWIKGRSGGYGIVYLNGIVYKTPRIAYFLETGIDPLKKWVLHRCDNPPCCNPSHLFLGTPKENSLDMASKFRFGYRSAKVSEIDAQEIRRLYSLGGITQRKLGEMYGIKNPSIFLILKNRTHRLRKT